MSTRRFAGVNDDRVGGMTRRELEDMIARMADRRARDLIASPGLREVAVPGSIPRRAIDGIPVVDVLPRTGTAGDEIYFEPEAGSMWRFVYAPGADAYPWRFVGGPELYTFTAGIGESTASTSYTTLTSATQFTAPLAGVYQFEFSCEAFNSAVGHIMVTAVQIGAEVLGTLPGDWDGARSSSEVVNSGVVGVGRRRGTVSAAGTVCRLLHRVTGGTGTFQLRHLSMIPVRAGRA